MQGFPIAIGPTLSELQICPLDRNRARLGGVSDMCGRLEALLLSL